MRLARLGLPRHWTIAPWHLALAAAAVLGLILMPLTSAWPLSVLAAQFLSLIAIATGLPLFALGLWLLRPPRKLAPKPVASHRRVSRDGWAFFFYFGLVQLLLIAAILLLELMLLWFMGPRTWTLVALGGLHCCALFLVAGMLARPRPGLVTLGLCWRAVHPAEFSSNLAAVGGELVLSERYAQAVAKDSGSDATSLAAITRALDIGSHGGESRDLALWQGHLTGFRHELGRRALACVRVSLSAMALALLLQIVLPASRIRPAFQPGNPGRLARWLVAQAQIFEELDPEKQLEAQAEQQKADNPNWRIADDATEYQTDEESDSSYQPGTDASGATEHLQPGSTTNPPVPWGQSDPADRQAGVDTGASAPVAEPPTGKEGAQTGQMGRDGDRPGGGGSQGIDDPDNAQAASSDGAGQASSNASDRPVKRVREVREQAVQAPSGSDGSPSRIRALTDTSMRNASEDGPAVSRVTERRQSGQTESAGGEGAQQGSNGQQQASGSQQQPGGGQQQAGGSQKPAGGSQQQAGGGQQQPGGGQQQAGGGQPQRGGGQQQTGGQPQRGGGQGQQQRGAQSGAGAGQSQRPEGQGQGSGSGSANDMGASGARAQALTGGRSGGPGQPGKSTPKSGNRSSGDPGQAPGSDQASGTGSGGSGQSASSGSGQGSASGQSPQDQTTQKTRLGSTSSSNHSSAKTGAGSGGGPGSSEGRPRSSPPPGEPLITVSLPPMSDQIQSLRAGKKDPNEKWSPTKQAESQDEHKGGEQTKEASGAGKTRTVVQRLPNWILLILEPESTTKKTE